MLESQFAGAVNQAWLRFWVSLHKGSLLEKYINPTVQLPPISIPLPAVIKERQKATKPPSAEWARNIVGDLRLAEITMKSFLEGLSDYFEIFSNLRKLDPDAYKYFSRVGAPIAAEGSAIWRSEFDRELIHCADNMPSHFGVFFPTAEKEYRKRILNDERYFGDFVYFQKVKTNKFASALGSTIFRQHTIFLKRNYLTKEELRGFPHARKNFGVWWTVGILADGSVKATPIQMNRAQHLPDGEWVYHSRFMIPPALNELGKGSPHDFVRRSFNATVAFAASATAGVQIMVKRDGITGRFGVPMSSIKTFFADRDPPTVGSRRRPIIHYRPAHTRMRSDGRRIEVGEHLAGVRQFRWRGYDINIGIPGIHFPSPEGFAAPLRYEDEVDPSDIVTLPKAGKIMAAAMRENENVSFRRGEPTTKFPRNTLQDLANER